MSNFLMPIEWALVKIDDVAEVKGGKRLPQGRVLSDEKTNFPYLRVTDFKNGSVDTSNLKYLDEETQHLIKQYTISSEDLYISIAGTIGLVGQIPDFLNGANLTENAAKLCNLNGVYKSYLRYVLNGNGAIEQFEDKMTSSGQPKLALFRIKDCLFPLPPLAEQKVIAEKLDTLMTQVDNTKARLERIPETLKRLRQSVLAAAVSGKLTEEWREINDLNSELDYREVCLNERFSTSGKKNIKLAKLQEQPSIDLPESWSWQALDEVNIKITDGTHHSPQSFPDGDYMYVTSKNVREGRIDLGNVTFVDEKTHREIFSRCDVKYADVLYVKDGANTGLSCVNNITEEFSLLSSVGVLRTCTFMVPTYVQHYLNSPIGRKLMLDLMGGTAIKRLTLTKIAISPISVPPRKEQTEIVRRVEELFAFADRIEHAAHAALSRVNNLTQSILAKAFRGELTADWRAANPELISGDNSAEALLAQIKAERAALVKKPKEAKV